MLVGSRQTDQMTELESDDRMDTEFSALCDDSIRRAYGLAGYLLGDPTEAEDSVQETMARAWRSRRTLRNRYLFDAWLDRILVAGKTFAYGENGPRGLVTGKRVIIALARGGFYNEGSPSADFEYLETYLRSVFSFIVPRDHREH